MYASQHIDWLTASIPKTSDFRSVFPTIAFTLSGKGIHGYRSAFTSLATGILVHTDSEDPSMGSTFQFSGDTLANIRREMGGIDTFLLARLARYRAKASRIDLTLNIHDGAITPGGMRHDLEAGKIRTRATTWRFVSGKAGEISGDTLYIGAPKSDSQFRCYDKNAELGVQNGEAWVRLEMELRRLRANAAFQSSALHGVPMVVSGYLGAFLDWNNREYTQALYGPSVEPTDIPRKDSSRRRWLLGQVTQALAKECVLDIQFKALFDASLQDAIDHLQK